MQNKFKPILYSTEMVDSLQNRIKTQTRRTKGLEIPNQNPDQYELLGWDKNYVVFKSAFGKLIDCKPKYQKGDILWVRETFEYFAADWDPHEDDLEISSTVVFNYKASDEKSLNEVKVKNVLGHKALIAIHRKEGWKPAIHMPKEAARLFIKVTDVRLERLQDISTEDAKAEGVKSFNHGYGGSPVGIWWKDYIYGNHNIETPELSFRTLWENINGAGSWNLNPWVWVYEFEVIEKPADFGIN